LTRLARCVCLPSVPNAKPHASIQISFNNQGNNRQ
jgi:hypothetical protein